MNHDLLIDSVYNCLTIFRKEVERLIRKQQDLIVTQDNNRLRQLLLEISLFFQVVFVEGSGEIPDCSIIDERQKTEFQSSCNVIQINHSQMNFEKKEYHSFLNRSLHTLLNDLKPLRFNDKLIGETLLANLQYNEAPEDHPIQGYLNSPDWNAICETWSYNKNNSREELPLFITKPRYPLLEEDQERRQRKIQQFTAKLNDYQSSTINNPTLLKENDLKDCLTHFRHHQTSHRFNPDWNIDSERDAQQEIYNHLISTLGDQNTGSGCLKSELKQKISYFFKGDTLNTDWLINGSEKLLDHLIINPKIDRSYWQTNRYNKFIEINEMMPRHLVVDVLLKIAQLTGATMSLFEERLKKVFTWSQFQKQGTVLWLRDFLETLNVALSINSPVRHSFLILP